MKEKIKKLAVSVLGYSIIAGIILNEKSSLKELTPYFSVGQSNLMVDLVEMKKPRVSLFTINN